MRVDFYVLEEVPAERVVAALAAKVRADGQRLLVVAQEAAQRQAISAMLWDARPELFLANGDAGAPHAESQPILLAETVEPLNGATMLCLADGQWRDCEGFERVFYLFDNAGRQQAREQWSRLSSVPDVEQRFWKQQDGKWIEGP